MVRSRALGEFLEMIKTVQQVHGQLRSGLDRAKGSEPMRKSANYKSIFK